jgi:hypothetical protein
VRALTDWWRRRRWTRPRIDHVEHYASVAEIPDDLDRHTVAVVGSAEAPKWAAVTCPCGNGHRLLVSLQRSHRPHWRLLVCDGAVGLEPSIDSIDERRCHFWLRDGRVEWVSDENDY